MQHVPHHGADDEARQVLPARERLRDPPAEDHEEERHAEQGQHREAHEEERPDAYVLKQVLDEREVHAPGEHGEQRRRQGPLFFLHFAQV
jgi:hypothetical protein